MARVGGRASGESAAQLEASGGEVGLQPEALAGGDVLLPGGARDGRHGPPGHRLQLPLLAQGQATRPYRCIVL